MSIGKVGSPSVLWRIVRADGSSAHAVLEANGSKTTLAWYLNHEIMGAEEFDTRAVAMRRAEELRMCVSIGS